MPGSGPIDTASPFFASLASQAVVHTGTAKTNENRKKERVGNTHFNKILKEELQGTETSDVFEVASNLKGLSPEKILEALLDEVHSSGDLLKEKQLPDTILAYKNAVRSFVRYIVDRTFSITESTSGGNILKRKKFTQVQIIDQKLEQLAAGILSNQRGQLELLGKIEEINGLLVDLMS